MGQCLLLELLLPKHKLPYMPRKELRFSPPYLKMFLTMKVFTVFGMIGNLVTRWQIFNVPIMEADSVGQEKPGDLLMEDGTVLTNKKPIKALVILQDVRKDQNRMDNPFRNRYWVCCNLLDWIDWKKIF